MDSVWSRIDQVVCATAPLLAATVLFACGYVVGRAVRDWYDSVPDYSCSGSESGSDDPDSDDDKDSESGENVSSAGGVTDDSAMEDYVPSPVGSDTEDDGAPGQELDTLIQPIECNDSDVEDPFLIEDVDERHPDAVEDGDHMEYEHMDAVRQPPVTDLDYERLDDDTEDEHPTTEQDDDPPVAETKG